MRILFWWEEVVELKWVCTSTINIFFVQKFTWKYLNIFYWLNLVPINIKTLTAHFVALQKGGGTIDLEPCLTHTSTIEPTLAPVTVERTMTTRAAASVCPSSYNKKKTDHKI